MRRVSEIGEMEWFREEQEKTNKIGFFNWERRTLRDFAEMWSGSKKKRRWAEVKRWRLGAEGCRFEHLDDNGVMKVAFLQLIMDRGVLKDHCVEIEGKILNVTERNNTWQVLWRKCVLKFSVRPRTHIQEVKDSHWAHKQTHLLT